MDERTFLTDGLRTIHDDAQRPAFLRAVWERRAALQSWMEADRYLSQRFETAYLPTFLHGGSPAGRIVVMGINPGWNSVANGQYEEPFKRSSAERYVEFHERFFEVFPALIAQGMRHSPWWTKLANVMSALLGDAKPARPERFSYLEGHCVVQDLIPFHSARDLVRPEEIEEQPVLAEVTSATLDGIRRSPARAVMAFSRQGHALLAPELSEPQHATLRGGRGKEVRVASGWIGETPTLLVANQILVQPAFAHAEMLPHLRALLSRFD